MAALRNPTSASSEEAAADRHQHLPVGVIATPVKAVKPQDGFEALMKTLVRQGMAPVIDRHKRLLGLLRDQDVLLAPDGEIGLPTVAAYLELIPSHYPLLYDTDTIGRARQCFAQSNLNLLPIVNTQGRYTGQCASRTMLFKLTHGLLRPPRAGGLATPLGVYMTSGYHISGAGLKGLVATGVMFGLLVHALDWLWLVGFSGLAVFYPTLLQLDFGQMLLLQTGLTLIMVLGLLRLTPLAGLHAAEHMTINAIENDLDLTPEVVHRQPREHVRCGTNLMVLLAGLQLLTMGVISLIGSVSWLGLSIYALFWGAVIFKFWKPAGLWLQRHFTTRPPSPTQVQSGLAAGRELLEKFSERPHPVPSLWRRLWGSGLIIMLASFLLTAWLAEWLLGQAGL